MTESNNNPTRILLSVDKQERENELVAALTHKANYDVWPVDAAHGSYLVKQGEYNPAVAIIEVGCAASEAIKAIEQLRKIRSFAIIALVDDEQEDEYFLLEHLGVDACLTREVMTFILLEKVEALLEAKQEEVKTSFTAGPIWLDPDTGRAKVDSRDVRLTEEEFALLRELAAEPFEFHGKETLVRKVLSVKAIGRSDVRHLERLAKGLRKKLQVTNRPLVVDNLGLGWRLLPETLMTPTHKHRRTAVSA